MHCPRFNFIRFFTSIAIAIAIIFFFVPMNTSVNAAAGINRQINFQGKLVNNPAATNVTDTSYTVVFTLYNNASGANTALWTETQTVITTDGIFRVALGSVTPFPANFNFNWSGLYLGIKVNSDAEMTPRVQMAAVPFAFNAEKVAGLTVQDDSASASTSGTLQIGNTKTVTFSGSNTLAFNDTSASTTITLPGTGAITLVNTAYTSTQTTGTVLGITDSTGLSGAITGMAITLSGAGVQDQTGLSFNLSGASGTNLNDIVGTGSSWKVSKAGALTVASCSGCGGAGSTNYWGLTSGGITGGLLYNANQTTDFAIAGISTSSALFSFSGVLTGKTIASASGNLIVMPNNGWGGQVGIGTTNPTAKLDILGVAANNGINIGGITTGTAVNLSTNLTTGTGINIPSITSTGNGISIGQLTGGSKGIYFGQFISGSTTTGINFAFGTSDGTAISLSSSSVTSGKSINLNTVASGSLPSFTGAYISIGGSRNASFGNSVTDTGNYLNISRNFASGNAGITYANAGDLVSLSSTCSVTNNGVCADTSHILSLTQSLASASGSVLFVNNLGQGMGADIESNSGGQAALLVNKTSTSGDIFTASQSGTPRFSLTLAGGIKLGTNEGTSGNCFLSGGAGVAAYWNTCPGGAAGVNWWNQVGGVLSPVNLNNDFAIGLTDTTNATKTAEFSFTGVQTGQTIASISGNLILMPNNGWGGNVGIGTTNPQANLEVNGSGGSSSFILTDDGANAYRQTFTTNTGTSLAWKWGTASNDSQFLTLTLAGGQNRWNNVGRDLLFQNTGGDRMIIKTTGLVGIGTTSPTATLDVAGAASVSGNLTFRTGAGAIQTTAFNALTLGGNTTGKILLSAFNGQTVTTGNTGSIAFGGYNNCTLKTDESGNLQCQTDLTGSGGGGYSPFQEITGVNGGVIAPNNSTMDFLVGGQSSSSAAFRVTGQSAFEGTLSVASVSGKTSFAALVVDNSGTGDIFTASASGATRFVVRQDGSVGIGNGSNVNAGYTLDVLGSARIGSSNTTGDDILKSTTSDFIQAGSTISQNDSVNTIATTGNQLALVTDLIGAGATITAPANGPSTSVNIGAGAIAFQRPDSKFVIVAAGGVNTTKIYDTSTTPNTVTNGPNLTLNTGAGTNAFQRQNGKFLVLLGGTNQTSIYDPGGTPNVGNIKTGPTTTAIIGVGSQVIRRSDGKFIIILGNGLPTTNIYDPTANPIGSSPAASDSGSFTAGPNLTANATTGSFAFETVYGKWIVGLGGNNVNTYDPVTATFTAGPSLAGGVSTGAGAHVIQRPDYTYLLILGGNSTGTQVYNPLTNTWTNTGTPTLGTPANAGSHSFQMSNHKWITVVGGGSVVTNLYDPINGGTYGGYTNGSVYDPELYAGNTAGAGALTFQTLDGKYVVVTGNAAQTTTIYDAGWNTTGTWTSETIGNTLISTYSAIMWTGDPQSTNNNARLDKATTDINVKTAANTGGLATSSWNSIANSGNLIGGVINPAAAVQMQVVFNVPVRSYPQLVTSTINQSNIWGGEGSTFNRRSFISPTIYTLRISNPMVQYGGLASDPSYGRNFATAGALLEGVVTDNNNQLTLATNRNLPTATNSAGFIIASSSANIGFSTGVGIGAFTIQMPNGQFLIVPGNALITTRIYDPDSNTFIAGPNTPSAAAAGGHAFQLPNGQFFVVLGGSKNTAIYDPASNVFYAGPQLANAAAAGAQTFQRPDGLFIIIAGTTTATNIYDPFLNQVTAGPGLVGGTAGAGTMIIRRPDGRITVLLGGTINSTTYDAATNAFTAGPAMTAGTMVAGSTAVQLSTGRFLIKTSAALTQTLDPITSTFTVGTATGGFTVAAGSFMIPRPDGKVLLAQGGTTATQMLDPDTGASNTTGSWTTAANSPVLPCVTGAGALVFQRPDGMYVLLCGGGATGNNAVVIDAGWNLGGSYFSEQIYEPGLSATSSLFWQNAGNQGNIYVKYRTAATQAALGVAAWKDARTSGSQITYNSGDVWIQTRFDLQGNLPDAPGAKSKMWLSTDTGAVTYYRSVQAPVLSYWKLMNATTPTLLTLTSNGSSAFRFSGDGQAYTAAGGAWNSGGADLAERYTSTQNLEAGDVVVGDRLNAQNVIRSTDSYQTNIMGVVSTQPGFVAGSYTPNSYPVALVGRVPVKISTENGLIHSGDYLTSASISGYAMKATTAGRVLGTALEDFDPLNALPCPADGAGSLPATQCGTITAFINLTNYNGQSVEMVMAEKGYLSSASSSAGLSIDVSSGFDGADSLAMKSVSDKQRNILGFLEQLKAQNGSEANSEIFTGRLSAIKEIISPTIIADLITAKTIRADHIEGLEILTNQISSLTNSVAVLGTDSARLAQSSGQLPTAFNLSSLNVDGLATVSADFSVKGSGFFQGALNVLEGITTQNLLVSQFAYFINDVVFKGNVRFNQVPTFSKDTAGFAVIKKDDDTVEVTFEQEYNSTPVITASIVLDKVGDRIAQKQLEDGILNGNIGYVITQRTTKGFVIRLNKPASQDLNFSWVALSVKDAKTSGPTPLTSITPDSSATPSAGVQSILNQLNNSAGSGGVQ